MKKTLFDDAGRKLKEYNRKRDFRQTAEPPPRSRKPRGGKELMFVIQKHAATRLHYDFRLEMEGVLKSWAVPKGLPYARGDKRLAVHVEDHPFDYAQFEGTIPEGNYGAGTVMVWDTGTYVIHDEDPLKALKAGKFHVTLKGKKLKGEWAFVRMKSHEGEKENWLIFKAGEDAKPVSARQEDRSVLTRRSMKQIGQQNRAQWQSDRPAASKSNLDKRIARALAKRHAVGEESNTPPRPKTQRPPKLNAAIKDLPSGKIGFIEPMKCKLVSKPPEGAQWIYEIKFDGFRALAVKDGESVVLLSRSNKELNARFPQIVEAMRELPLKRGIVDGEIVALDEHGRSSFQLLQMANMQGFQHAPLAYYAFDLINMDGKDLRNLPLNRRKELLQSLITPEQEPVLFSPNIHGAPQRLLDEIKQRGLEGIIAKKLDSKYEAGLRTGCWQKIKVVNEQEFIIGGYTAPKGSRDHFGAILIGYREGERLVFVSKVGTGFDQALLASMFQKFKGLQRTECPFANLPEKRAGRFGQGLTASEMRKCTWIEPKLVCEVRYTEWTRDNHLRHPVFMGLRDDVRPEEVRKEKPA